MQLTLTNDIAEGSDIWVQADPLRLKQTIINLLSNAVKYNKDGGTVDLTILKDGDFFTINCKDTGIGISKSDQKKLFGEFSRIKTKETRNISGSGLGLSILKKISNLYDGEIELESEQDKGSTFALKLRANMDNKQEDQA